MGSSPGPWKSCVTRTRKIVLMVQSEMATTSVADHWQRQTDSFRDSSPPDFRDSSPPTTPTEHLQTGTTLVDVERRALESEDVVPPPPTKSKLSDSAVGSEHNREDNPAAAVTAARSPTTVESHEQHPTPRASTGGNMSMKFFSGIQVREMLHFCFYFLARLLSIFSYRLDYRLSSFFFLM